MERCFRFEMNVFPYLQLYNLAGIVAEMALWTRTMDWSGSHFHPILIGYPY